MHATAKMTAWQPFTAVHKSKRSATLDDKIYITELGEPNPDPRMKAGQYINWATDELD